MLDRLGEVALLLYKLDDVHLLLQLISSFFESPLPSTLLAAFDTVGEPREEIILAVRQFLSREKLRLFTIESSDLQILLLF